MATLEDQAPDQAKIERYNADADNAIAIRSLDDIRRVSNIFVQSGMFKNDNRFSEAQKMYQAGVKIIAGVEFGIQPFAAMRGINIINGNAEMSANLMAAKVKSHPKYDYRVKQWDTDGCVIEFYELPRPGAQRKEWDLLGESSFNAEDAQNAGLARNDTWRKFARNMYFARAISNGVRIHCPDVFYGAPVYTEGEISGEFEDQAAPTENTPAVPQSADTVQEAEVVADAEPDGSEESVAAGFDALEVADEVKGEVAPPSEEDQLATLKVQINKELTAQTYTADVRKKAFISKVLGQSKIETIDQANDVIEALRINKETLEEGI